MNDPSLACRTQDRHARLREANAPVEGRLYGLDYLQLDRDAQGRLKGTLTVTFIGRAPGAPDGPGLTRENLVIRGGRRVRDLTVTGVVMDYAEAKAPGQTGPKRPGQDDRMIVSYDKPGDFSTYTLAVVNPDDPTQPWPGFDPRYSQVDFSFQAGCPSDLDCKPLPSCPPPSGDEPEIDYLAKDYASFRQAILDRLSVIMPQWQERHAADLGIALVEVLAYVGDYLSYYQDAVATEAYLGTARRRVSVRRHARLVDYAMHEGCNARAWVCVQTSADVALYLHDITFFTGMPQGMSPGAQMLTPHQIANLPPGSYEVFRPLALPPAEQRPDFVEDDIRDPAGLVEALIGQAPPWARYLWGGAFQSLQEKLRAYAARPEGGDIREVLAKGLTEAVYDDELYAPDKGRNLGPDARPETARLAARKPSGAELHRLNRWLLEGAFPGALASERQVYFYQAHNEISFYTWGEQECCLVRGATSATLVAGPPLDEGEQYPPAGALQLRKGDVLFFEEVLGPKTGIKGDADPTRRRPVRLTKVTPAFDPLDHNRPLVEIEWALQDALPFPFCLSAVVTEYVDPDMGTISRCKLVPDISVARGNVLPVDHGRWVSPPELLPPVPDAKVQISCEGADRPVEPPRYQPKLGNAPLTFRQPLVRAALEGPARDTLLQDPAQAVPHIHLALVPPGYEPETEFWVAQRDLIDSGPQDRHFVVEIDNEGKAQLRFGDGQLGQRPLAGQRFRARYRVGNGTAGNVGAGAISRVALAPGAGGVTLRPRNPLPANGGIDPEPLDSVRALAPFNFRKELKRAVTTDDYATLAVKYPGVQRAAATLRWMGSWYEVLVAIDPFGEAEADPDLLQKVQHSLEPFRRMGHDVIVKRAHYVPLDVALTVCVLPHYFRGHVEAALRDVLGSGRLPDGRLAFFHPDNLTFGQSIAASKVIAVAQAVEGVQNVVVTVRRLFEGPEQAAIDVQSEILAIGPLEIPRLDNDPSFPENGRLTLDLRGGR